MSKPRSTKPARKKRPTKKRTTIPKRHKKRKIMRAPTPRRQRGSFPSEPVEVPTEPRPAVAQEQPHTTPADGSPAAPPPKTPAWDAWERRHGDRTLGK